MEDEYNIKINNEEGYSPEAIANFERSVEEFSETFLRLCLFKSLSKRRYFFITI